MGSIKPGSVLPSARFQITAEEPTAALFTPQTLRFMMGYGIEGVSKERTAGDVPKDLFFLDPEGLTLGIRFEDGQSIGGPFLGNQLDRNERVIMVDPEGWMVTNEPAYYDLYPGDGNMYRFDASTNSDKYLRFVLYRNIQGREETSGGGGVEVIRDENNVLRQVVVPTRFADIVVSNEWEYSILFYPLADVQDKGTNGYYTVRTNATPVVRWVIESPPPSSVDKLRVSEIVGSSTNISDYAYVGAGEWTLTKGGGLQLKTRDLVWDSGLQNMWSTFTSRGQDGAIVYKATDKYATFPWGMSRVEGVEDPDGLCLTTTFTYHDDAGVTGKYGKVKTAKKPDGSWMTFDYNASGKKTLKVVPWKDSPPDSPEDAAYATYYDYAPVDPRDVGVLNDNRARTITEKALGIVVAKTFLAYITNSSGEFMEVEEKCVNPTAAYGDPTSLRTVKTYYSAAAGNQLVGRLKSEQYPDGRLDTSAYDYGNYLWDANPAACRFQPDPNGSSFRTTVTHGTTNSPNGIVNKTTRETSIADPANNDVLTETYVYTGGTNYERLEWEVREFDFFGHATKTVRSNGEMEDASWGSGCCGRDNETDASGIVKVFGHDALKRLTSETKRGTNSPMDDLITSYTYDGADRQLTRTISGGGLSLMTSNEYDAVGRLLKTTDPATLITGHAYTNGGRTEMVTRPGGATEITEKYLDGQIKSLTGTTVIQQFYDYGVNPDGSRWTKVYTGATNSPMWEKTTANILGRTIRVEKPGFSGVETNTFFYDLKGRLVKQTQSGIADTLFDYDELSNPARTGLDVNRNGTLDLASMDRIVDAESRYALIGSNWWQETEQKVYAQDNNATPKTVSVQRKAIGSGCSCRADQVVSIDVYSNQTITTTAIDRDLKRVTRTTTYPNSTNAAVEVMVNGLLQSQTSKTGIKSTFAYDALERPIGVVDPRTGMNVTHYNDKGQIDYTEDAASNRTTYAYDPLTGQKVSQTDAMANSVFYAYDLRGQLVGAWGATYPVLYDYDDHGRMTALYTLRDNTIATNTSYLGFRVQSSGFDKTCWFYDEATGLLTNKSYADSSAVSYSYGTAGQLTRRTWARGLTADYSYDAVGSLTNINYSDSTPDVTFSYDRLGRQKLAHSVGVYTNSFAYDSHFQLTNETQVSVFGTPVRTNTLARSYDAFGRPTGISLDKPSYSVRYSYDTAGRFNSVSSSVLSVSSVVKYSYLSNADLIAGWSNNAGLSVSRAYESHRDLLATVFNRWNGSLVSSFAYTNDALGRRTRRIDSGSRTNDFGYNIRSELASAAMGTNQYGYTYDPIGNREWARMNANTNRYTANELNQYLSVTSATSMVNLSYDPDGNLTNYNGWTFAWDAENRLIAAKSATQKVENTYDYMSRRIEKKVYSWATDHWSLVTDHSFLYDGWNLIRETQVSGFSTQVSDFVWGLDLSGTLQGAGGIGGLLASINHQPYTINHFLHDANGNVTDLVNTNGALAAHYEYDPYGNTLVASGSAAAANPYQFSSKYLDPETGMYYYGYRFYCPNLGRWLNRDPIGERGGLNLYAFVFNSPVHVIDFLGLAPGDIGVPRPGSGGRGQNCMGHALCDSGKWEQGAPRTKDNPWPEEKYLKGKGCREIKCDESCDSSKKEQKVKLYEWKNEDQFHIVRENGSGKWSGKTGLGPIYDFPDPDKHTSEAYKIKPQDWRDTCWCCPCKK